MRIPFVSKWWSSLAILICMSIGSKAQVGNQVLEKIDDWQAYVKYPADYNQNPSKRYPVIIFMTGLADVGNNPANILSFGPALFISQGHSMEFTVNGVLETPLVISLQPNDGWPGVITISSYIDAIRNRYRIDNNRIALIGHSMGGWAWDSYIMASGSNAAVPAAIVSMSSPAPSYPANNIRPFALAGGWWWGFEGNNDYRAVDLRRNAMNSARAGSARYTTYNGDHCCWNTFYDPSWKENGESIYEWVLSKRKNAPPPNQLPLVRASNDTTLVLPQSTLTLSATASDADGTITNRVWRKLSGPAATTFQNVSPTEITISNLDLGTLLFEFAATDNSNATVRDTVRIVVKNKVNTVSAGIDQTVQLPTNVTTLSGTNGNEYGTQSISWTQINGPTASSIAQPQMLSTTVSGLAAGSYSFRLAVLNNEGLTEADTVVVLVASPPPTIPPILVNIFGGTNPFNNAAWNNWNCISSAGNSGALKFSDGTNSSIVARLSQSDGIGDNGANYSGSLAPAEVLRYTSHAGGPSRTLTISGLNPALSYDFQFFGSRLRTDDQRTTYTIGTTSVTIATDNNRTNAASFFGIKPNASGGVVVTLTRPSNRIFTYLNGFSIQVNGQSANQPPVVNAGANRTVTLPLATISLVGTATDADGSITRTVWTQVSGNPLLITDSLSLNTTISNLQAGTFVFRLSATDNKGAIASANVTITILAAPPPLVSAGADQVIVLPMNTATLVATASSNDGIQEVLWQRISGPGNASITQPTANETQLLNLAEGNHSFRFTATTFQNISASDTVLVAVTPNNYPPPAIVDSVGCGTPVKIVILGSSTAASNGTTHPDSSWVNKFRRYIKSRHAANEVINLAAAALNTYHVLCPTGFTPPANRPAPLAAHNITAALALHPDLIIINLPSNDVANGYSLQESYANYERALGLAYEKGIPVFVTTAQPRNFGTAMSNQSMLLNTWTYQRFGNQAIDFWTSFATASGSIVTKYDADGIHPNNMGHHLLYTRAVEKQILDYMCMRQQATRPVVQAGVDQQVQLPIQNITLTGTAADATYAISQVRWRQISGPTSLLTSQPNAYSTNVSNLQPGQYKFEFIAYTLAATSSSDTVEINIATEVINQKPLVNAGPDLYIQLPVNQILLEASAADADGTIQTTQWSKWIGGEATISQPNSLTTLVSQLTAGTYQFLFTATDNLGATSSDTVKLTVEAAPNNLPIALAGADVVVEWPTNTASLDGSSSTDTDGQLVSYTWRKLTGGPVLIQQPNAAITLLTNLDYGSYTFELMVTDNRNAISRDTVSVDVISWGNLAPVANAGSDLVVQEPVASVLLNGTASFDRNGQIVSYLWRQISGPSLANMATPAQASNLVSNILAGTYQFELEVTDNENSAAKDTVSVVVQPRVVLPPAPVRNRILIDFGPPPSLGVRTITDRWGKYWNNVEDSREGVRLNNARDTANRATTLGLDVIRRLDGTFNVSGTGTNGGNTTIGEIGDYPSSATVDNLMVHNSTTQGRWRIFGLDPSSKYSFKFWGTRATTGQRITQIKLAGESTFTKEFNAINNRNYNQAVMYTNITGVSEVLFDIRLKPGDQFGSISVLDIVSESNSSQTRLKSPNTVLPGGLVSEKPLANASPAIKAHAYPNPARETIAVDLAGAYRGTLQLVLVDATGLVKQQSVAQKQTDAMRIVLPINQLQNGWYILRIVAGHEQLIQKVWKQ